jgi:hypothetical protein
LIVVPRPLSRLLGLGAQTDARGATRCLSQLLDRGAQAVDLGAATLSQQDKNKSADVQRNRVNITGCTCTVTSQPSPLCTFDEFESLAVALRRR